MNASLMVSKQRVLAALPLALFLTTTHLGAQNAVQQTNLVSDLPGMAQFTDPNLVNPWGISESGGSPFWISNAGTGTSTLYNTAGKPQGLVVTIPGASPTFNNGQSIPTGQVFNGGTAFNGDKFIFASIDGAITGWRGALGTTAETLWNQSSSHASYTGLAIGKVGPDSFLYAADFGKGSIDVFGNAGPAFLTGSFVDPTLPSGYSPFNIQNLNGDLYVTYALVNTTTHRDQAGVGNGFVDEFDLQGNLVKRLASQGDLNSPWGVAIAPAGFGWFAGDVLVGNFGDGKINVFGSSGNFIEQLSNGDGTLVQNDGLWALQFGNGGAGGKIDTLYFTAGIDGEQHGLFGSLTAVPEPSTIYAGLSLVGVCGYMFFRRRMKTTA